MSTGWVALPLLLITSLIVFFVILIVELLTTVLTLPPGTTFTTADLLATPVFVVTVLVFSITLFVLDILLAWMTYKLIRRRNTHFGRQQLFFEDVRRAISEQAAKKGVDASIQLNNLERSVREARLDENEKNPVLWVALTLASTAIPSAAILRSTGFTTGFLSLIAMLYIYYFLMKDFYKHERREDLFINDLLAALRITGLNVSLPYRNPPMPERSLALYVVLTIITAGFFWVYWVYVLLNDPNHHFRQQMMIEDTIMAQLSGASPPAPLPGPPPPN